MKGVDTHMAWVNTTRAQLPGRRIRSFTYLVFIAKDPEGATADDGEPCYIVCVPDIDGCVTQGFGTEDAYFMGRDAASLLLDDMSNWVRPEPSPYNRARRKVEALFSDIEGAENLDWEASWVEMLVPYKDLGPSKYTVQDDE